MKRLTRSTSDRMIAGICGGIGHTYDIDPTLVRLGLVFLWLITALLPVFAVYVIAWFIIPLDTDVPPTT